MPVATSLDKDAIREAYEDVRSDLTDTEWAVFKFDGAQIIVHGRGQCFEQFREQFGDSERAFGYIRIQMGDEMSKRKKFIFLTWIGQEVGVIQRAKMSTDKALIKDVLNVSATGRGSARLGVNFNIRPSSFSCRTSPWSCRRVSRRSWTLSCSARR